MKGTLTFSLTEKYERQAHMRALKADKAYYVLSALDTHLRDLIKYQENDEAKIHAYAECRRVLNDLIEDQGIQMDEEWT